MHFTCVVRFCRVFQGVEKGRIGNKWVKTEKNFYIWARPDYSSNFLLNYNQSNNSNKNNNKKYFTLWDYSFITFAKFSEKLKFFIL